MVGHLNCVRAEKLALMSTRKEMNSFHTVKTNCGSLSEMVVIRPREEGSSFTHGQTKDVR